MNPLLPPTLLLLLLASIAGAQDAGLLPNPSFETSIESRPKGWRVFPSPSDAVGEFYVTNGTEGETTRTGISALQFHFPRGGELSQCAWMADPVYGGVAVEPGRYSCSFWVKAVDLEPGAHTWLSIVGFGPDNARTGEIARSDYLAAKDFQGADWTRVRFSFEILPDGGVARVAPTVVFKTQPDSSVNAVPAATRVIYDDLELTKD